MRIGELADLVGVTSRTIRHYHQLGVLPEPERAANGYRVYTVRDAVALARVKRLKALGLSLSEVREVVADARGGDLRRALLALDADLEREEARIGAQRARLADLLERGGPDAGDPTAGDLAAVLLSVPVEPGGVAALERDYAALVDATLDEAPHPPVTHLVRSLAGDAEYVATMHRLYAAMDDLVDAAPDDPRVPALAEEIAAAMPRELIDLLPEDPEAALLEDQPGIDLFLSELAPAPAEVARRALRSIGRRRTVGPASGGGPED